jgi:hypothetical protein
MKKTITTTSLKELKQNGFKQVTGFNSLFINHAGNIYDREAGKYLTRTKNNYIRTGSGYLSVPKLILLAFKGENYRAGRITHIDGNRANLEPDNIKYASLFNTGHTVEVNQDDLMTAIRCYFEVGKSYLVKDAFKTRFFIQLIIEKRGFFSEISGLEFQEIYKSYFTGTQNTISKTAQKHGITVRDCSILVNSFTNLLITEILEDLKNGELAINDFAPRKRSNRQELKDWENWSEGIKKSTA